MSEAPRAWVVTRRWHVQADSAREAIELTARPAPIQDGRGPGEIAHYETAARRAEDQGEAEQLAEYEQLNARMSHLLTETAAALKGPPPPLTMHDWSDLPRVAAALREQRDTLAARQAGPASR